MIENINFKYERFFELSPDLLCIAGYDGYFKKINPAVCMALGYSMEELLSRPINDFVYRDDQDITSKVRKELTRSQPLFNFENRYQTKTGEIVWLSWTSFPVETDRLIFAIAKNITHKKQLEAERNTLLTNLTKINRDLRDLAYTTSHDLRSPVNNLLSLFEMMQPSQVVDHETTELFKVLHLAGENLRQTLNNYLDLLNERQTKQVTLEEIDLNECLKDVLESVSSLIQTSKATIQYDFSKVDKVTFNKEYMRSVFLNLITNSVKYSRPECALVISIYTSKESGITRLIFSDNGQGLDMEKVQDEIFGLNQKFHNYADSKGIGLYLVHSHITSMGGKISVDSKVNEGTKFTISFRK